MGGGRRGRRNSSEAQTDTLPSFASLRDRTDAAGKELQAPFQDETFKDETGSSHAQAVCLPLASSHILSVQHCASVSIATEEPPHTRQRLALQSKLAVTAKDSERLKPQHVTSERRTLSR